MQCLFGLERECSAKTCPAFTKGDECSLIGDAEKIREFAEARRTLDAMERINEESKMFRPLGEMLAGAVTQLLGTLKDSLPELIKLKINQVKAGLEREPELATLRHENTKTLLEQEKEALKAGDYFEAGHVPPKKKSTKRKGGNAEPRRRRPRST